MFLIPKKQNTNNVPKWKKRFVQVCLGIFLSVGLLFLLLDTYASKMVFRSQSPAQQAQIIDAKNPEQFVKHIIINGVNLYVPAVYFAAYLPSETEMKNQIFKVRYPSFTWAKDEPYQSRFYNENDVIVSISEKGRGSPLTHHTKEDRILDFMENTYGLEKWTSVRMELFGHIYIKGSKDDPELILKCDIEKEWSDIRTCTMLFFNKSLFYSIKFDHKHLPQWSDIYQKTNNLIEQFQVKPAS